MILLAERAPERVHKSRASNNGAAYKGLLYERTAVKMLKTILPKSMSLEHNPWFYYQSSTDRSACAPDVLIHDEDFGYTIVVEIKYTWTPLALVKLKTLYCPVVTRALHRPTKPVVLVKNLTLDAPQPQSSLTFALLSPEPLIQWIGRGNIKL